MFGPSTIASPHQAIASFGSAFLRGLEGALGLGVVEREGQAEALVEVGLCLRVARSHLEGQRAQVVVQRYFAARGLHRLWLEGFGLGLREDQLVKQGRTLGRRPAKRLAVEQWIELVVAANADGGDERQSANRGKGQRHAQVIRLHGCSFRRWDGRTQRRIGYALPFSASCACCQVRQPPGVRSA